VKSSSRRSGFWQRFLADRPSPTFIRWVRWILFLWWVVLLLLEGPDFIRRFHEIRATSVSGFDRSAALQRLVVDGLTELVALPLVILAMFGYGIAIDRVTMISGGPWFRTWWGSSRSQDSRKRQ